MAVLLTGGSGKASMRMTRYLRESNIPFLLASRRDPDAAPFRTPAVKFDWLDASTYQNPFSYEFEHGVSIGAVYLVAPGVPDPTPPMIAFIDFCVSRGVKRFVLLAGYGSGKGKGHGGAVWQHLDDIGVEYGVLCPMWFMGKLSHILVEELNSFSLENFSEQQYALSIRAENKFYSAAQDGKSGFVSAADIAHVAFHGLKALKLEPGTSWTVVGPELLTYDEIAEKLTRGLGRKVEHIKVSRENSARHFIDLGMPDPLAYMMADFEVGTANGIGEFLNDHVEKATGQRPMTFDEWIQENKGAFA